MSLWDMHVPTDPFCPHQEQKHQQWVCLYEYVFPSPKGASSLCAHARSYLCLLSKGRRGQDNLAGHTPLPKAVSGPVFSLLLEPNASTWELSHSTAFRLR